MNRCEFIGRPVKALELKKTSNGNNILTFTLAVKREYKNANGEYDSDFIRLKAFKNTANFISNYVYPELRALVVRYSMTAKRQQVPVTTINVKYTAYGELP